MKAVLAFSVLVAGTVAVVFLIVAVGAGADEPPPPPTANELKLRGERDRARRYARRLESVVYREVSRAERNERRVRHTRRVVRRALGTSPLGNHWIESAFLCIHGHEGRWDDPNPPFWGGLQMDWSFQRAYGSEYLRAFGPADKWPRSVQVAVAIKAWLSRGFGPWPNTRKMCGV